MELAELIKTLMIYKIRIDVRPQPAGELYIIMSKRENTLHDVSFFIYPWEVDTGEFEEKIRFYVKRII